MFFGRAFQANTMIPSFVSSILFESSIIALCYLLRIRIFENYPEKDQQG
jgi:hypothetical protein